MLIRCMSTLFIRNRRSYSGWTLHHSSDNFDVYILSPTGCCKLLIYDDNRHVTSPPSSFQMQGGFPWIFKVSTGYQSTWCHDSEEHYVELTLVFMYGSYSVYTSAAWRRIKEAGTLFCLKTAFNAASQFMNHESCLSAESHIAPHEIFITWRKPFSSCVCLSVAISDGSLETHLIYFSLCCSETPHVTHKDSFLASITAMLKAK